MSRTVELIYDRDCPNVEAARSQLRRVLDQLELPPRWQEWERAGPDAPAYVKRYGSPTILVDGHDVSGGSTEADSKCCRVYRDADGRMRGVPPLEVIRAALLGNPT